MSLHRRNPKRDKSEREIVGALLRLGWSVKQISIPGGGDLLAGRRGQTFVIECKTGTRKLRANQQAWHDEWKGSPVVVLRNAEEAIRFSQMHD